MVAARLLAPYFDVQLRFAERMSASAPLPFGEAVAHFTNLHRRFGYGKIAVRGIDKRFDEYVARMAALADPAARVAFTVDWYARCMPMPTWPEVFGCFNHDPPDAEGVVRIHFNPIDLSDGTGPLHADKADKRRREVRAMAEHVATEYPEATRIRGASWLYNVAAYRRIFPQAYAASVKPIDGDIRYEGMSSWGQFLNHRGEIKLSLVEAFRDNLPELDPAVPWRVFPLPVLRAEAPLPAFLD